MPPAPQRSTADRECGVLAVLVLIGLGVSGHSSGDLVYEQCSIVEHHLRGDESVRFSSRPPEGFQGLTLEAPDSVFVKQIEPGRFIWDRDVSTPKETTYEGALYLKGTFSIFVPNGEQERIWSDLSNKIDFVVIDLKSGKVHKRNRVDGGWNLARAGVSVMMTPPPFEIKFDPSGYPGNTIDFKHFTIEVFDDLSSMPEPDTTLEIYVEYMGFKSNPVQVCVMRQAEDSPDK